ncbi:MAG: CHAT domain-containing protein [Pseudomonadales bacterium]
MTFTLPVVFLAFANSQDEHLATLKQESHDVFGVLQPLKKDGKIDIHREESANFDELYDGLLAHDGNISIFHYGGHASGTGLRLEGGFGGAKGIAGLLGDQTRLKLVFLNGCATKDQVKHLQDAGVPAVIATAVKINDARATKFSTAFYAALAEGKSIPKAFELASNYLQGSQGANGAEDITTHRFMHFEDEELEEDSSAEFEWALYTRSDCAEDLAQWRLPRAQEGWRVRLIDSRGPICGIDDEPLEIEHSLRKRTINAVVCQHCGTNSSVASCDAQTCPICASSDTKFGKVNTAIADQLLPNVVIEAEARQRIVDAAQFPDGLILSLHSVYLPYWVFDVGTRTALEAQRGGFDPETLKVDWQNVEEEFDAEFASVLVPAGQAPVGRDVNAEDWYWELEKAQPLEQIKSVDLIVPLEIDIQSGFNKVVKSVDEFVENECLDKIGGHQQKNITTHTSYRHLACRSVLLPHWYATIEADGAIASVLVNGQTGAVRFPQLPGMQNLSNKSNTAMSQRTFEPSGNQAKTSLRASVYSGVGIGIMVGLLLGLAAPTDGDAKTVVSIFIGAVGVGLAALLGLNDKHFSTAKGLRIGSFGFAVAISAVIGIYMRANGVLSPSLNDEVQAVVEASGLGKKEAMRAVLAKQTTPGSKESRVSMTALFSAPVSLESCYNLQPQPRLSENPLKPNDVIENIKLQGGPSWEKFANEVVKNLPNNPVDQQAVLELSRDTVCKFESFRGWTMPKAAECELLSKISNKPATEQEVSEAYSPPVLKQVTERVSSTVTEKNQLVALKLMGGMLCSSKEDD